MKMNELYGQIAELKGQVTAQYSAENKSSTEKTSLNKHIEGLNSNLVKYNKKLEVVEADNRRLMQVIPIIFVDYLIGRISYSLSLMHLILHRIIIISNKQI